LAEVSDIILIKLALTPLLIASLTFIGRRWGPVVSGAIAGLPLTSGPVSVFLALEQGKSFAAHAAIGTLTGLIGVAAFCLTYARMASRKNWIASALAGTLAFLVVALLLLFARLGLIATFVTVVLLLAIVFGAMPKATNVLTNATRAHPKWDLPLRMAIATSLVFLLTAVAAKLGPQVTGLVSPFPVFGGVLAIFAHRHFRAGDAQRVLRSVIVASFAFAVFFLIVGASLLRFGIPISYGLATFVALVTNVALLKWQLFRIGGQAPRP
jgi:hypothetical protein